MFDAALPVAALSDAALSNAAPPAPAPASSAPGRLAAHLDVVAVVAVLVAANLVAHFTTAWAAVVTVPAAAAALVAITRARGLGWVELGLGRAHWRAGARYAAAAVAVVAGGIAVGVLLPWTRPLFLNDHYATPAAALVAALVIIPLQTVIPEELAFRGVLHGTLTRAWGIRVVAVAGSLLFGFWHVATSLGLTAGNAGLTRVLGSGVAAAAAGVVLAVLATAGAGLVFTWLRGRTNSLIAPIALHWALNGLGALTAALVWHLSG